MPIGKGLRYLTKKNQFSSNISSDFLKNISSIVNRYKRRLFADNNELTSFWVVYLIENKWKVFLKF